MTTQAREPEMGLTFEKVWAMFQESDRRMQKMAEETDQRQKELDKQIGKLGNRFGELAEHTETGKATNEKSTALSPEPSCPTTSKPPPSKLVFTSSSKPETPLK
jgi:seryl-tRNA synthetase